MRYTTAGAFRTALERRLLTTAQTTYIPLVRLRKLVVFDRLMARLHIAAPDRWILKGALALDYRIDGRFRTTKDLDLACQDSEAEAAEDFLAAQSLDLQDYFSFVIEAAGRVDGVFEGSTLRYRVSAELAGRLFEHVVVDIGFGDPLIFPPELVRGPDLLSFAEISAVEVFALPLEQHVAEKVHAYTRTYAGGRPSSRVKDLIDLGLIRLHASFEALRLRLALQATFDYRARHPLIKAMPHPPGDWSRAYRRLANEVGLDPNITVGYALVASFLDPVLDGSAAEGMYWDPSSGKWE